MSERLRSRITLRPDAIAFQTDASPAPERTYERDYSPQDLLGEGGMGRVFTAKDRNIGRRVAIKELKADVRSRPEFWVRFVREAQIGGQLEHPNIVPIYAFQYGPDGGPAFVMQLVDGESLADYLERVRASFVSKSQDTPTLKERLGKLLPICDAVSYAHGRGVLHRDLKPENVMLGPHNVVLLTDWGIARVESDEEGAAASASADDTHIGTAATLVANEPKTGLAPTALDPWPSSSTPGSLKTAAGTVLGTPQYMSPEQALGVALGPASDQYALGLMLLELATLRTARTHEDTRAAYAQAVLGEQCAHRDLNDRALDPRLSAIVARATQKDPAARYASVDAFAADIRAFTRDEELAVLPDSPARKFLRSLQGHPARSVSVLALVLLGLSAWATAGTASSARKAEDARHDAETLSQLTSTVLAEGNAIGRYLLSMDQNLSGLAENIRVRVNDPRPLLGHPPRVLEPEQLKVAPNAGLVLSPIDGAARSFEEPVFVFAPDASPLARVQATRIAAAKRDLIDLYLDGLDEGADRLPKAEQRALMVGSQKGIVRLMVALESGLFMQFPGRTDLPTDLDRRKLDWYEQTIHTPGRLFTRPKYGPLGRIPRMAVSRRIEFEGKSIGVTAAGFWLKPLVEMLGAQGAHHLTAAFLAAPDGKEIVSHELLAAEGQGTPESPIPLSDVRSTQLARALGHGKTTGYVVDGKRLFIFTRIPVEDWFLVHEYPLHRYLKLVR